MISLIAASAALLTGSISHGQQPTPVDKTASLVVTGSSEIRVTPDVATMQVGVTIQAKTASAAQSEANKRIADFLNAAKTLLGDKGTVQTGALNLSPVYSQFNGGNGDMGTSTITAYRADEAITVRTTDFSLVGPVLDAGVASGVNTIQGIDFGLQDDTQARMQALAKAVQQARAKAEVMAEAAGVSLVGIWEISEQGARVTSYAAAPMMARGASPTPVEPGQVTVGGDVTIKFFIQAKS